MKRGKIFRVTDSNSERERKKTEEVVHSHTQTQCSGSSFSDLPRDILVNILLRLSIEMIFVCKFVCKTWYGLISDPEFANQHFDQAEVYPLIRTKSGRYGSKMVHLVQPDKDDFELKLEMSDHTLSNMPGFVSNVHRFEIPKGYGLIKHHNKYGIVTCNGLLCLSYTSDERLWFQPPIVCNPITGEFINLPTAKKINLVYSIRYGFGFSPATNQYKVLRMFDRDTRVANKAEVHILGTKTWKDIGSCSQSIPMLSPAYLNGFLYWFHKSHIFTFDIENERFGSISAPDQVFLYKSVSVGVLGGELSISGILESRAIHVWTMKDNGTEKEWSIVFSFDHLLYSYPKRHYGPFQPIKYLNDGALLMFDSQEDALVYMDPKESRFRYFKVRQFNEMVKLEAYAYIPSFVSLEHVLSGHNVKVLNVKSR